VDRGQLDKRPLDLGSQVLIVYVWVHHHIHFTNRPTRRTYVRRFGSWQLAIESAERERRKVNRERQPADVLPEA